MTRVVIEEKQEPPREKEPIRVSFSLPQITGGALAAATAAAIGSQLGVAGTILGAMVASIVGGVAGTLYSAGIDRTHRRVSEAILRGYDRLRHDPSHDPDELRGLEADGGTTRVLPGVVAAGDVPTQVLPGLDDTVFRPGPDATRAEPPPPSEAPRRRSPVRTVMALTVGAMFLVALSVVTVVELGLGHSLGGGSGTTVGQVVQPRSSAKPTPTPTATVTTTATASPTATETPTATGTPTATPDPTATTPSGSGTPTAVSTETSVPAGNAQPSQSAQAVG